jgi:hypothetical protein
MEHEAKVRNKIRSLELTAVTWNKKEAWAAIKKEPKAATNRFYYYAAAMLLLTLVLFYTYQLQYKEQGINKEVAKVKQQNQNTPKEIQHPTKDALAIIETHDAHELIEPKISVSNSILSFKKDAPVPAPKKDSVVADFAVIKEPVAVPVTDTLAVAKTETQVSTIEPIIGVYFPKKESIAHKKEKKLHIKLFSMPEERYATNQTSAPLITVRIN